MTPDYGHFLIFHKFLFVNPYTKILSTSGEKTCTCECVWLVGQSEKAHCYAT